MTKPLRPKLSYVYAATVRHVVDGDTLAVDIDLGFHTWARMLCRLTGIDAPERNTPAGKAAAEYLAGLLGVGDAVLCESVTVDKYGGRFDARVWRGTRCLNDAMVAAEHAEPWVMGAAPKPYKL